MAPNVHCNDGSCIANENVCDTTEDCPDGEDELNCGKYSRKYVPITLKEFKIIFASSFDVID